MASEKLTLVLDDYCLRPKARPRHHQGKIYTATSKSERSLALEVRLLSGGVCFSGKVKVSCVQETTHQAPGDIDNMLKTMLDALQKSGVVANDRSVKACEFFCVENQEKNRLKIEVSHLEGQK